MTEREKAHPYGFIAAVPPSRQALRWALAMSSKPRADGRVGVGNFVHLDEGRVVLLDYGRQGKMVMFNGEVIAESEEAAQQKLRRFINAVHVDFKPLDDQELFR